MSMTPEGDVRIQWHLPDGSVMEAPGWTRLNLLACADTVDLDIPQACGGHAECGTCRVRLLSGELTPSRIEEQDLMRKFPRRFQAHERLACQTRPRGDVALAVLAVRPPDLREVEAGD
jgi:ferredoxin